MRVKGRGAIVPLRRCGEKKVGAVSNIEMPWLIPLCLCVTVLALVTAVFVASVRNARALRRDLTRRFDAVEARLEKQANALADELLARTNDTPE
jgi:hypothetical protein